MAIDHRVGTKVMKQARREDAPGTRVDPYPYIGIVKNNLDPTRSGRLQVWIPDLGGDETEPKNWRTVSYASPFSGYTSQKNQDSPSDLNKFGVVHHTYGMWMVPPDIGVQVIVIFIAGDPLRGFWLACVNPNLSHYMIPALGGTTAVDPNTLGAGEREELKKGAAMPVAEFNQYNKGWTDSAFYLFNKPVHRVQYDILISQGLALDRTRGVISSSSQRESPSYVFGLSTPGRPINDPAEDKNFLENLKAGKLDPKYDSVQTRKGGHTFVLDDGAIMGEDQLIRLRTAQGHQILMHDTNKTIYVGHATGKSWIEMTKDGAVNVYSSSGLNFRSEGTINLHGDKDLNIDIKESIKIKAGGDIRIEGAQFECLSSGKFNVTAGAGTALNTNGFFVDSQAKISLKASQVAIEGGSTKIQSGGTVAVKALQPLKTNQLSDTAGGTSGWSVVPNKLKTIVTIAPTHEPFKRDTESAFTLTSPGIQPAETFNGSVDYTKQSSVTDSNVTSPAGDKDLRNQPPSDCTFGALTTDDMTAYYAQLGKSESGGSYIPNPPGAPEPGLNPYGYAGKYQFGAQALQDLGYIRKDLKTDYATIGKAEHIRLIRDPNSWTGKNGISSLQDWLNNGPEQESAICEFTRRNYTAMLSNGAITKDLPKEDLAGMLMVSHLLGAGGARNWRNGQGKTDANGTSGDVYFARGKYAIVALAPKVADINAG